MALPKWLYPWKTTLAHPSTGPVYPQSVHELDFELKARPVYLAGVVNTSQNAIRNAGTDTWDEFWYRSTSYNMTNWALWYNAMLEFFTNHNAQSAQVIVTNTSVTTGAATATLTCAAGHAYKVTFASTQNDTRAPTATLVYTPNGGTAAQILDTGANAGAQGVSNALLGGVTTNGVTGCFHAMTRELWMQASDTLVITNANYVGGDTVIHNFVYEDYTL